MLKNKISRNAILYSKNHIDADKKTIKKFMSGQKLMQNAGKCIFHSLKKESKKRNIKILCGPGNNGGDGYIAASLLDKADFNIEVYSSISEKKLKGDAKTAASKWRGPIKNISNFTASKNDLIIDGLFGSGLKKNISGNIKKVIKKINLKKLDCVSIDIPSGIDGDTGEIKGIAIKAKKTITFTRKKPGHLLNPGYDYSGIVQIMNIGINLEKLSFKPLILENNPDNWIKNFPWPDATSHKYTRGYALIIGGEKMTGATRLAVRGAGRIGCGLLCLGVPKESFDIYSSENPICLVEIVDTQKDLKTLLNDDRINTVLIGPGLGISKKKLDYIHQIIKTKKRKTVLDADALKNNFKTILSKIKGTVVITPHEGEFSKVLKNLKIKKIPGDKLSNALKFAKKTKLYLILKGYSTIICSPNGKASIDRNSSPFLATGGSGDVLSGMITGLLAQGMKTFDACCAAVWIHGEVSKIKGPGLIAEDIPEMLPNVLKKLKNYRHN